MPSTSLKLSQELKRRIAKVIQGSDTTMHAFLVRAAERATEAAERRAEFVAAALKSRAEVAKTRRGYTPDEVEAWARKRVAGGRQVRPRAKAWR